MQPTSDFGPTVWILVAIVAAVLFAIAFSLRKFDFDVAGDEPGDPLPLQDHTHTTPFE